MQSEDFQLLPSEVDTVVTNQYTFVTHTQSSLIVDIFECRGKSTIVYDEFRKNLNNNKNKLDIVGISNQPHAVRINRMSTTFYKITAELAVIRWFPFDIKKGVGTGYLDYQIGKLKYDSGILGVKLIWQGLSKKDDTKSIIISANHTVYISTREQDLQSGSQCQAYLQSDTWKIQNLVQQKQAIELDRSFDFRVSKNKLVKRFGENVTLYTTVVIDVILAPSEDKDQEQYLERYRFIYPGTEIPGEIVNNGLIDTLDYSQIITILFLIAVSIILLGCICTRKILPMLGFLKNHYLVEENDPFPMENKVGTEAQQDLVVPPSSDRQAVNFNGVMENMEKNENES